MRELEKEEEVSLLFFFFLLNTSSTVNRSRSSVIDFSLPSPFLLVGLADSYRPPDNARSHFKDSFYSKFTESSHRSPFVKTFQ